MKSRIFLTLIIIIITIINIILFRDFYNKNIKNNEVDMKSAPLNILQ